MNHFLRRHGIFAWWTATLGLSLGMGAYCAFVRWRTHSRPTQVFVAVAATYALAVAAGLYFRTSRALLFRITKPALMMLASMAVSVAILEVSIRVMSPPSVFDARLDLRPRQRVAVGVEIPGVKNGLFSTNRWGLRGEEPPKNWNAFETLLACGGSTTLCFYLDDERTWTHQLQQRLRKSRPQTWVGNGGLDGHSTRGHLVFFDRVVATVRPDACLVLVGVNDMYLSIRKDYQLHGNPYETSGYDRDLVLGAMRTLHAHSRLVQLGYLWKQIVFDRVTVVKTAGHAAWKPTPLPPDREPLPDDVRSLLPQLPEFRDNLRTLIRRGRELKVRTIFLTQPFLFEDTKAWSEIAALEYWRPGKEAVVLSAAETARLLAVYNDTLREVCREEDTECFDLAKELGHDAAYFYDSCHFTDAGAARVAELLAEYLNRTRATGEAPGP